MKREKKFVTFLSAVCKYGLRFVKQLCLHVQVLGVVAIGKDERQVYNTSYCWQQPLEFSVELWISIEMYCWEAAKRSQVAITGLLLFRKSTGVFFTMPFLPHKGFALTGRLKTAKCECLWSSRTDGSSNYLLLKIKQFCSSQNRPTFYIMLKPHTNFLSTSHWHAFTNALH